MTLKFSNSASATLASSITSAATSISVSSGLGALFPSLAAGDYFYATLVNSSNLLEIVKVTARSGDVLTVTRAQEATTARAYNSGDKLELRLTAAGMSNLAQLDSPNTFAGATTLTGGTMTGTYAGTHTYSGAVTFSSTITGSVSGNAGTVTNGVYTTGAQTIAGAKTFSNDLTVTSTLVNIGNGTAGEKRLFLQHSTCNVYFYNSTSSVVGLWDVGASQNRFTTDASGNFVATGNVTAYSDENLKTDWSSLADDYVERLAKIKFGTYTRTDTGKRQAGASAQDFQRLLPEVVQDGEHLSLAYGNAALVSAAQLAREVVDIKRRLAELEA